jgi:hypothetical protein
MSFIASLDALRLSLFFLLASLLSCKSSLFCFSLSLLPFFFLALGFFLLALLLFLNFDLGFQLGRLTKQLFHAISVLLPLMSSGLSLFRVLLVCLAASLFLLACNVFANIFCSDVSHSIKNGG